MNSTATPLAIHRRGLRLAARDPESSIPDEKFSNPSDAPARSPRLDCHAEMRSLALRGWPRQLCTKIHRWSGLAILVFLLIASLSTGSPRRSCKVNRVNAITLAPAAHPAALEDKSGTREHSHCAVNTRSLNFRLTGAEQRKK